MPKLNDTGVYRKKNGCWEYRFAVVVDGKTIARKKCTDDQGNKLKTKSEAVAAREKAIVAVKTERRDRPIPARRRVKEVFEEFCSEGRKDRAYMTIRKQDSLWENHIRDRFGDRYVDEISCADVVDYLSELYYVDNLAFRYHSPLFFMKVSQSRSLFNNVQNQLFIPHLSATTVDSFIILIYLYAVGLESSHILANSTTVIVPLSYLA